MRSEGRPSLDRRTVLAMLGSGSTLAVAGCSGGGTTADGGEATGAPTTTTGRPTASVPDSYVTATAQGGQTRNPDGLSSQSAVNYQPQPKDGQQCSGCQYYIPDRNGDGMGACAIVEGTVDPQGWCVSYVAYEQSSQAVSVPQDASCAVCEMNAAKFPKWNAQATHDDDTRAFFCSTGCATTYYAVPDQFADTGSSLAGLWVTDFDSGEFVDGTSAYYALETDSDRLDDPMRLNPAAFADRADAVDYVDAVDHLGESDVVELSAFDRELASQYRSRFLE